MKFRISLLWLQDFTENSKLIERFNDFYFRDIPHNSTWTLLRQQEQKLTNDFGAAPFVQSYILFGVLIHA